MKSNPQLEGTLEYYPIRFLGGKEITDGTPIFTGVITAIIP